MTLTAGTRVGPYEIVGPIGSGGMGEVYRARDSKLNRDVALKVLPPSVRMDPDRLARFRREAQVLAALNHPNIAHVHGFEDGSSSTRSGQAGSDGSEVHALVMELVEGPTLADRIAQGAIPIAEALPIAKQIAEAMETAHDQGIVHRDLKPSNIKVKEDGTVKVLDFGLAKALGTDSAVGSSPDVMNSPTLSLRATQLGVILGTAAYMAPEQAKGRPVDRRADIWAFGVILFEMITGRRGYEAEDITETLAAVLTRDVDWTALPDSVPARLKALIRDCLVRDARQRLRDIGDARRELQKMIDGPPEPTSATPVPPPAVTPARPSLLPWAIAGIALVVGAGGLAVALRRPSPAPRAVTRAETILKDFSVLVDVSRDGSKVAYAVAGGSGPTYIALRMVDQFEAKPIPGTDNGAWPLFSPDGQWIAYGDLSGAKLHKVPITGGASIALCDGSFAAGATWGGDDLIVFSSSKGLMKVSAAGGPPSPLTTVDEGKGETAHQRPQFLPDGKHLLFTVQMKNTNDGPQFAMLDLSTGAYRMIGRSGINGRYVRSGHLLYVRSGTLFAVPFDLETSTITGTEVPVVEDVSQVGPENTGDYAVSDDGLLVYFAATTLAQGTTLAWTDRSGKITPLPGQSTRRWGTGRLSPDGRLVANGITDANGGRDIWIFDVARGTPTRVSFGGTNDNPTWTRDSRRIFFGGTQDAKTGLFRAPVDASAKPELVLATPQPITPNSVSPDGNTVVFTERAPGKPPRLMLVDVGAGAKPGEPRPLHDSNSAEIQGQISPDGRWIAYVSSESGTFEVYLHAFPVGGARIRVSTDGGQSPRWSPDGRELFYWSGTPTTRLFSVDIPKDDALRPGTPKTVLQHLVGTTWDVTPDRDRFLIELTSSIEGVRFSMVTNWFEELSRIARAKR